MGNGSTRARADSTRIAIALWLGVDEVIAGGETGPDDFFFKLANERQARARRRSNLWPRETEQVVMAIFFEFLGKFGAPQ